MTSRQLVLDLGRDPSFDADDFLVSACNETAFAAVLAWPAWPDRALVLLGPPGSGKSHLAAIWASRTEAVYLGPGARLPVALQQGQAVVIEDCDRFPPDEVALFHQLNILRAAGGWLLITAREQPDFWGLQTPDLLSRLRLAPTMSIGHPDLVLIKSVIVKLFSDRQIVVDEETVAYAARHCERSFSAATRFVAAADSFSLAFRRPITRPLAAQILAGADEIGSTDTASGF